MAPMHGPRGRRFAPNWRSRGRRFGTVFTGALVRQARLDRRMDAALIHHCRDTARAMLAAQWGSSRSMLRKLRRDDKTFTLQQLEALQVQFRQMAGGGCVGNEPSPMYRWWHA